MSKISIVLKLIKLIKNLIPQMIMAILTGVAGFLCATFITVLGGYAILNIMNFDFALSIETLFLLMAIFAVLRGILRYGEQTFNHYIAFKILANIRDKVFLKLRSLCPAKLEGKDRGDLISLITSDVELLEVFYAHTISPVAIAFIMSVIMSLFIGSFHIFMGILSIIAYVTVGITVPVFVSKSGKDTGNIYRNESGELSSYVLESLRGTDEILQYGNLQNRISNIDKKTDELLKTDFKLKSLAGFGRGFTNSVILFFDFLMLILVSWLYTKGSIDFSGVLIPIIALMSSFGPVVALANLGSTLQQTFASGERILKLLDEKETISEVFGKKDIEFNGIECNNVTFKYKEEEILKDYGFSLEEKNILGIMGASGSGKSTLLKLIMRFYDVNSGEIKISDVNIKDINTSNLRDMEAYVTQETHLFKDSIKENVKIANLNATDEEIESACKKASIHDFIMSLPKGYDTPVAELGESLSGGEKQRLGIARAFVHNSKLLLLDEPTSNLDVLNEGVILNSLNKEREDKTVILVSHRKSTMSVADKVIGINEGKNVK